MKGVQFVVDDKGRKIGVFVDLLKNAALWEDVFDVALVRQRAHEPRTAIAAVRKQLVRAGKLSPKAG